MNEELYRQLLGRMLDDELSPEEAVALARELESSQVRRHEARRQLSFWERFEQEHRGERRGENFVEAWKTRAEAEDDAGKFVAGVASELRKAETATATSSRRGWMELARDWLGFLSRGIRQPFAAIGTAAFILAGLAWWLFPRMTAFPTLADTHGRVTVQRGEVRLEAAKGIVLQPGDIVTASRTNIGRVALTYAPEATQVELEPGAELKIGPGRNGKLLELRAGQLRVAAARQRLFHPMVVTTPEAAARVVGTRFALRTGDAASRLEVEEGEVEFARRQEAGGVRVKAGRYAIVAAGVALNALPNTGHIRRETWNDIPGSKANDLLFHPDFPARPAHTELLATFSSPLAQTNSTGCRLTGWVHPPVTGEYVFWISGAAEAVLFISPDADPENKSRQAAASASGPEEWDRRSVSGFVASQQTSPVPMSAGKAYYLEAVQKTAHGPSHVAVAWQRPGGRRELLRGEYVSPVPPP